MSGYIGNIPTPQATQTRETFTATASQTTFNTAGYTPGFVDVWLNGVKLVNGDDFTATNGSDVVLTVGAASGDTVEVLSFSTFEVNSQTFTGDTSAVNLNVTGTFTSRGIDDNATSTAMTLDGSGNLLVGKTSADNSAGATIKPDGEGYFVKSNGSPLAANRLSTDGVIQYFFKDTSLVGSIGTQGGDKLTIGNGDVGVAFNPNADSIYPWNTATNGLRDGGVDLGYSDGSTNIRFRNLYLSGGVYVGGTGAANYLDDYEEGTFTPTLGGNYTGTYIDQYGHYTKIGNVVTFRVFLGIGTTGGSGTVYVAGLPFASSSVAGYTAYQGWTNSWASNAHPQFLLTVNSTTINVYTIPSSGGVTQNTIANMGSSGNIIITGHYYTDA